MKSYFTKLTVLLALMLTVSVLSLHSEEDATIRKNLKENLPYLMGSNNAGTLFYLAFHPCWETNSNGNALRIYVSAAVATTVTMEIKGLGIFRQKMTVPNDVIDFTLPPPEGQPYTKNDVTKPFPEQIWEGRAIKITSDDPIICYGVTRFYATSDGYLALPASALGKNYQVASYADPANNTGQWLPSYTSIIGIYENTKVTFTMGGCESCYALKENGEYLRYNQIIKRTLNECDVWLIPGIGPFNDLTGSTVKGNKPISVISGNFCAYIPTPVAACDFIIEQEMPDNIWGKTYHVTPILTRKAYGIIKIFAKKSETQINVDGIPNITIHNPGGVKDNGYVEQRTAALGPGETVPMPVEISSSEAINVVQFNPGSQDDGIENDPFQLQLTPIEQYQTEIVFNTPGIRGAYGFKNNFINIVYKATVDGGIPDDMMWAEVQDGHFKWTPMSIYSGNPGLRFKKTEEDGRHYNSKSIKLPFDGVYRIKANDPFCAYAYGSDYYDSYGFPTSVAVSDLESPDSLAPYIQFAKDCGGFVAGRTTDEPRLDPENRSNLGLVFLASEDSYNYTFKYTPFVAGQDEKTDWKLNIRNASLNARAHLVFIDRVGNRADTVIQHYAISPSLSPYYRDYGTFKVETPNIQKTMQFTVKNEGDNAIGSNYSVYVILDSDNPEDKPGDINTYQNFDLETIKGINLSPMAVGQERKFNIKFTAVAEGTYRDSIGIIVIDKSTGDTCVRQFFSLLEAFVGNPYITATDKNFMEQVVGSRTPKYDLTITNPVSGQYSATTALKITGIDFSNSDLGVVGSGTVFEVEGLENISPTNPLVINKGESRTFSVSFMPKAVQNYSSKITFIADATLPKNYSIIEGIGIQPALEVNGDNWGERLVDPNAYIVKPGPYPYTPYLSPNGAIKLTNDGTANVTITSATIATDNHGEGFIVKDPNDVNKYVSLTKPGVLDILFKNKPIAPGVPYIVDVYFDPKVSGNHELVINFTSDAGDRNSTLAGIGVFPRVNTANLAFGHSIVGTGVKTGSVEYRSFVNQFDYPVTITGFEAMASNGITTITDINGNGIFRWDVTKIFKNGNVNDVVSLPQVLQPDEYLTVPGEFEPTIAGSFEATLTTVSDAEKEAVSIWTGTSEVENSVMTPASGSTCLNSPITLRPKIENLGTNPLTITEFIKTGNNAGQIEITSPTLPITIQPGVPQEITVLFTPTSTYQNEVCTIIAKTTSVTKPLDSTTVTISSSHTIQSSYSLVSIGGNNEGTAKHVVVDPGKGDAIGYTVFLNTTGGVSLATSQVFSVEVKYNKSFVAVRKIEGTKTPKADVSDFMKSLGWSATADVTAYDKATNMETLTIVCSNPNGALKGDYGIKPIVNVAFDSYLGYYLKENNGNPNFNTDTTVFEHTILNNDACVDYTSETSRASLNPTCVDSLRPIQISAVKYGLQSIAPNPVGANGADVNFSVGGNNIFTEVKIYNSNSELVSTIFSGTLSSGNYSARIPVQDLSSGMYFIEMVSGPYRSGYEKLVINK